MNNDVIFNELPILKTDRLLLKKIEVDHLEELFAIYHNEVVFEYCGIIPKHNKETVKKMIGHFERDFGKKKRVKWGIFTNDVLVGIIEAFDFNQKVNMVTIGYYLAEEYWGSGIATEAVNVLLKFLFNEGNLNRVQAEVMLKNESSKKVLLKNGFTKEGILRQAAIWSGKGIVDLEIYSLLKEEYILTK